jgi:hypothetical protein
VTRVMKRRLLLSSRSGGEKGKASLLKGARGTRHYLEQ